MTCLCGDTQCPSCGLAQGTLERDTRRHITVWDWMEIHEKVESALDDPRIDRVKLKLRKKVAGLSDEDEQAAICGGAPCFLSIVVRADPMPDKEIRRIERVADLATPGPWEEAVETSPDGLFQFSGIYSDVAQHHVATSVNTEGDSAFIADARTSVPDLCRALRQAKAMIPLDTYFASLKGAKKWVAYRLRDVTVEGKPLPTVLKYNVSVRTQAAGGAIEDGGDGMTDDELELAIEKANAEVSRLRRWVADLQAGTVVTCVYCGHRYGPNESTPTCMADVLKTHIEVCEEHPMSKMKRDYIAIQQLFYNAITVLDRWDNRRQGCGSTFDSFESDLRNCLSRQNHAAVDWRSIESAPKDGTSILVWDNGYPMVVRWESWPVGGENPNGCDPGSPPDGYDEGWVIPGTLEVITDEPQWWAVIVPPRLSDGD